jgi:hypothetical protein
MRERTANQSFYKKPQINNIDSSIENVIDLISNGITSLGIDLTKRQLVKEDVVEICI